MTRSRTLLLAVLAVLIVAWATTSSNVIFVRQPAVPETAPQAGTRGPVGFEMDVAVTRLADAREAPRDGGRNPFRFAGDTRAPREPAPAVPASRLTAPEQPAVPSAPLVSLIGVAERTVNGRTVRVAVLLMGGKVLYASTGERVGGRYEVTGVGADAVELTDLTDGSTRRLGLR
jgi:hypothetical protein